MRVSHLGRYALGISLAAALLAACGGSQPPIGAPGAIAQTGVRTATVASVSEKPSGSSYKLIYNFEGTPDGANPDTTLTVVGGAFYGTASCGGNNNKGAVFEVSTSGQERVLYSFKGAPDGDDPQAGLVYDNGKFSVRLWGAERRATGRCLK